MIIEKISMTLFGKMKKRTFDFDGGINVIEGENESGKSTVASFVHYMFYGVSKGTASELYQKYFLLNGGKGEGMLELSSAQGRFHIERKTDVSNGEEQVVIIDLATGAPLKETDPAALFLGIDEETFMRTCMLSQLYGHIVSPKELGETVQNLLTGADESVNAGKAIERLKGELATLEKDTLPKMTVAVASAEKEYQKAVSEEEEYEKMTVSYGETLKKAENDRKELTEYRKKVERADALQKIERIKRAAQAEQRMRAEEEACENYCAEHSAEGFFPDKGYVKDLIAIGSDLDRCTSTLEEHKNALQRKKEQLTVLPSPVEGKEGQLLADIQHCIDRAASHKMYFIISVIAAVLCLTASVVLFVMKQPIIGVLALILVLAVGAIGVSMFMNFHKAKEAENAFYTSVGADSREELSKAVERQAKLLGQIAFLEKETEEEERVIAKVEEKYAELLEKGRSYAEKWGKCATEPAELSDIIHEAEEVYGRYEELCAKEKQARLEYNTLQLDVSEEELKRLFALAKSEGGEKMPTPEEYKEWTVKVNFYRQTSEALDKKTAVQNEQLHKMELSMGDSFEAEETLNERKETLATAEQRAELLKNAIAVLEESLAQLRAELLPGISKEASAFLSTATGGKYTRLTAKDDFTVTVQNAEGVELPVTCLSVGMAEVAYMAVRFALSDRIFGQKKMPLILDESFAYLDDLRQAAAFMAIAERAKEEKNQVFFFTCRKRESALFERFATVNKIGL